MTQRPTRRVWSVQHAFFFKGERDDLLRPPVAGCVVIAIPITILFIIMQKFYVSGITVGADKG